jgi:hypothetical protein
MEEHCERFIKPASLNYSLYWNLENKMICILKNLDILFMCSYFNNKLVYKKIRYNKSGKYYKVEIEGI